MIPNRIPLPEGLYTVKRQMPSWASCTLTFFAPIHLVANGHRICHDFSNMHLNRCRAQLLQTSVLRAAFRVRVEARVAVGFCQGRPHYDQTHACYGHRIIVVIKMYVGFLAATPSPHRHLKMRDENMHRCRRL